LPKAGFGEMALDALGHLVLGERGQQVRGGPTFLVRLGGDRRPHRVDGWQAQLGQHQLEPGRFDYSGIGGSIAEMRKRCSLPLPANPWCVLNRDTALLRSLTAACGRYCCKSLFTLMVINSLGRGRDFRVKMWGTSSADNKLASDLGNSIKAAQIAVAD
jgi:hypothetical protein